MPLPVTALAQSVRDKRCIAPGLPVLANEKATHALPLAEARVAGGLPVPEIMSRSPDALLGV